MRALSVLPVSVYRRARSAGSCCVCLESWESAGARRRFNRGLVLIYRLRGRRFRFELECGSDDVVSVFRSGRELLVLSSNDGLGYMGLQVFSLDSCEEVGSVFGQSEWELAEMVGREPFELSAATCARRLSEYCVN